ncbi:hypothetical protein LTR10_022300 [Elasticomyces elasticus]|uniref:DUF1446-domain-containing protein n=1 Tax=Exophiala sideris TaxID=1016849 RepID=A0ABR0J664_9EURO|nr:hypothetical protein LTR10_022300 [Elasticomyces elasticus]KAK5028790.1 hypothetical protein LTS07_006169 [Exophiala sideris]KAK5035659.1 hypothetical protein LTR13_005788 [Exophiala sideris]KAK5057294.1 hypothetical protein LTR69_007333 [Exophiala sideris]KAK5181733.1 hypothetical protein LTR44_005933 [Eurotiomycetes sp. CCFEE 6388]
MSGVRQPIRIGNASGAIGDGIDQIYRLAKSGDVDAITADYLAEFNLAWKAIELQSTPDLGYETNFLDQLAWNNGEAARLVAANRIKIVHNGGALNPAGLACKVSQYLDELGLLDIKVCWLAGDNVTDKVRHGLLGSIHHLDSKDCPLDFSSSKLLTANVYTGCAGIVQALKAGADIVICGRCCDASPVMGLATWWHGWELDEFDKLAGSLMGGHLIECGAYVTGGNYCGAAEIPNLYHVGYPIAEISHDGTVVITKPKGTNGLISIDTCKAQLLYEIQGFYYLNADCIANIEGVELLQLGPNRVQLLGVQGLPPPSTAKLAVCLLGGYQAELSSFAAGLDTDFKFELFKGQLLGSLDSSKFTVVSIEKYGTTGSNPRTQKQSTVQFRVFLQAEHKEAIQEFKRAIFYNGMQGYCGLHLSMDWRTLEPRPYVKYVPATVSQELVALQVHFVKSAPTIDVPPTQTSRFLKVLPSQPNYEPEKGPKDSSLLDTVTRPLGDLVFARSGDKGGNANVGFWVRDDISWLWLRTFMTTQKLIELLADDWNDCYVVERCEFRGLWAVHFVVKGILQEGVSSSSILDGFAKSFGEFLRARHVGLPVSLLQFEQDRRRQGCLTNKAAKL